METLPSINTTYQVSKKADARILETPFGDGYRQRAGDGINAIVDEWSLSWTVGAVDANTLTDFFEARGGHESFGWTPHGESVAKKWTCKTWSKTPVEAKDPTGEEVWSISASFKQEFDLD